MLPVISAQIYEFVDIDEGKVHIFGRISCHYANIIYDLSATELISMQRGLVDGPHLCTNYALFNKQFLA